MVTFLKKTELSNVIESLAQMEQVLHNIIALMESKSPNYSYDWNEKEFLIIEDDYVNFMYLKEVFDNTGVKIIRALSSEHALELVSKNDFDLILLDINLSDKTGYDIAKAIKGKFKYLPVIALTNAASRDDIEKSLESGCDMYIQKHLDNNQLLLNISELLAQSALIKTLGALLPNR